MKTNYIFNEKVFVEKFLNKTLEYDKSKLSEKFIIKLLYRYYRDNNLTTKEIKDNIKNDILNNFNNIQEYKLVKSINSVIAKEKKLNKGLREIENIKVFKDEFDYIKEINNQKWEKFLFTCLCISKFYNNQWVNTPYSEIFKIANISLNLNDKLNFIGDLTRAEKIHMSNSNQNLALNIEIPHNKDCNEIMFEINNMENLGNMYLSKSKQSYIQCTNCGKLIKIKSNRSCYCNKCAKDMELEKYKRYNNKRLTK